jgi:L-asparagine transporter-like permease
MFTLVWLIVFFSPVTLEEEEKKKERRKSSVNNINMHTKLYFIEFDMILCLHVIIFVKKFDNKTYLNERFDEF